MWEEVVTKYMLLPSTLVANIDAEQNEEEEDTWVASFSNLKCSIIEANGREDNRVGVIGMNSDMLVGH